MSRVEVVYHTDDGVHRTHYEDEQSAEDFLTAVGGEGFVAT